MKKVLIGVLAIAFLVGGFAFSRSTGEAKSNSLYYFPTDDAGFLLTRVIPLEGYSYLPCVGTLPEFCSRAYSENEVIIEGQEVYLKEWIDEDDGEPDYMHE